MVPFSSMLACPILTAIFIASVVDFIHAGLDLSTDDIRQFISSRDQHLLYICQSGAAIVVGFLQHLLRRSAEFLNEFVKEFSVIRAQFALEVFDANLAQIYIKQEKALGLK